MEFVNSLFDGKIRGIAATIIKAVLDETIDLHYVFSVDFEDDWCNAFDLTTAHETLYSDWLYSLDYILQYSPSERDQVFGCTMYKGTSHSGSEVAQEVIACIHTEHYTDESIVLDATEWIGYELVPHLLSHPEFFYLGNDFELESRIHQETVGFCSSSSLILPSPEGEDKYMIEGPSCELLSLVMDDAKNPFTDTFCYGFAASLINAVVFDALYRKYMEVHFISKEEVQRAAEYNLCNTRPHIIVEELPTSLCEPAKKIVGAYMPKAISSFGKKLDITDMYYDDENPQYLLRKMYEAEKEKGGMPVESRLWKLFTPKQQQMFLAHYEYFINYLEKECGLETETVNTEEPRPSGDLFSYITEEAIKAGKGEKIESELQASCQGTAGTLWKAIRVNESLDYLKIMHLGSAAIYRAFSEHFGELHYTERNFRDARSKQ